ncbi:MAG: hypothetical protein JWO46_2332, partial [Nocardioidaceae bacterium]|nr:hypothetical protein [Nocardioidaceae bacterium]
MSLSPALRRAGSGVLVSALVLGAQTVLAASPAAAATSYTVSTTADVATNAGACGSSSTTAPSPLSLREATCLANNSGAASITINVPAGTYTLVNGELKLGKVSGSNITLVGAGAASTIIDGNNTSRVLDLDSTFAGGVSTAISGVTISNGKDDTNGGAGIIGGSGTHAPTDSLTLTNVVMTGNHANVASPAVINRPGGALQFLGGSLSIVGSTFSNNSSGSSDGSAVEYGAYGIASPEGLTIDSSTFSGNTVANTSGQTATAKGGALSLFGTAGSTFAVSNSRFVNNAVTATAGSGDAVGAGILQHSGQLTVTESAFTGNTVSGGNGSQQGGAVKVDGSATATLRYNRFAGNTAGTSGGAVQGDGSVTATQNWWACNAGPGNAGCDTTAGAGMLTTSPRLVLTASVSPATIAGPNASGTVSATFATDSAGTTVGATNLDAFAALPVTFSDPPGDATVTLAAGAHAAAITSGTATIDLHTNTTSGPSSVNTTFDNATVGAPYTVTAAPAITSANTVSFQNGQASTFTVTTTGYPTPAITRTGALPTGVTFTDNGNGTATLAGTPTQGGSFPLSLTAANGVTPNATQTLTLNVGQPPAITSAASATFTSGSAGSFTVTTSGVPTVSTITETGALPAGLSFTDNGNGTATLAGTPTDSGTFPVTLTATNGLSPNATQSLTVTVNKAPAITTNPSDQTVSPGSSVTFTAAASGFPSPTVQWQRSTNGGASFSNIAGATSTSYTFTAAAGDNGNLYRAVFTNLVSSATTTAAALNVGTAPTFTSAATTRFQVGTAGTFGITTTGVPSATLSRLGVGFPAWLTLTDNGDGTGTLTGTPPAGFGGSYTFTLKAANGFSPSASQNFTLNVDDSPVITSTDHATFEVGTAGSFAVTATAGYPTSTALTRTGTLPTGVTFVDNGDGTATLAGTPATGKGGSYPITITATATGGTAPAATQSFTLRVDEKPAITSADHATFAVGAAGSFTVTTTAGFPVATTLSRTGSLPTGVTFTDNGDGTATLTGTPAAATPGIYPMTLRAANGAGTRQQAFTLTVQPANQSPVITSTDHTTFPAGTPGTFTVTTTAGYPVNTTIIRTGSLPSGVTFTDNRDGTATLAGTPTTGGSYPL